MGFVIVGMAVCLYISGINGLFLKAFDGNMFYVTTTVTPITEEIAKALPIFFFAYLFSDSREQLFCVSIALGMGFAVLENAYLMIDTDDITLRWSLIRAFGSGLMHSICTASVGYGISFIKKRESCFSAELSHF